jgi:hypothetical protein
MGEKEAAIDPREIPFAIISRKNPLAFSAGLAAERQTWRDLF